MAKSDLVIGTSIDSGKRFAFDLEAATQTFAFIARKGAGKTYAAGKLVELLLDAKVQCAIIDPVGNWYGLRIAKDGKSPGFDVPIFGGLRGDIPLEPTGGQLVADAIVDTGRSVIVDVSQFSLADRRRFITSFGEHLWQLKKKQHVQTPIHLVIEESQLVIPQAVKGDTARMVGIFEEIVRLGRNFGIGVSMITQRPQSVNKEVLNQAECLVVLQVNGSQERKALKEWITTHGQDVNLVDELPGLPRGTAYIWSPQWLQVLEKVAIGQKITFDASATPKPGQRKLRRELKPLDLGELKEKMKATIEQAKANDPKALRAEIADLKRQLAKAPAPAPGRAAPGKTIEKIVPDVKAIERAIAQNNREWMSRVKEVEKARKVVIDRLAKIGQLCHVNGEASLPAITPPPMPPMPAMPAMPGKTHGPGPATMAHIAELNEKVRASAITPATITEGLTPAKQRIIDAIAWFEAVGITEPSRDNVAAIAGASSRSSAYMNNVSSLHAAHAMVVYPRSGDLALTEAGRAAATPPQIPPTLEALHEAWFAAKVITPAIGRILRVLILRHPDAISREDLAAAAGASPASSAYMNNVSRLSSLKLAVYPDKGMVKANEDLLFPAALV